LGVLDLEDALKALRSIKSDTPLVYDFSQRNGEIRYGDMVVYRESGEDSMVEELVWDIEGKWCAESKSLLRGFYPYWLSSQTTILGLAMKMLF